MASRGDDLIQSRIDKLEKIKLAHFDPYPAKSKRQQTIGVARSLAEDAEVAIAGRLMGWRAHGGSTFADVRDDSGEIQVLFKHDTLGDENYAVLKNFDAGDFIDVSGVLFTTQAGELTIEVHAFELLTKSIRPLPSEHYGIKDIETRLRKRYLDLIFNPQSKEIFRKKALFWHNVRQFLVEKGFMEVETPTLELIPGGAEARPFTTHHNALDIDLYLRISLELYQKRLLVGGFEKTFEIGRIFRNEGIDAEHLQDYTQMEFYLAYANYEQLMELTEEMFKVVILKTFGTTTVTSHGQTIDFGQPWKRLDYFDAFHSATQIDLKNTSVEELTAKAKELGIKHEPKIGKGRLIDLLYKKTIRPKIIEPTHLINHPVDVSPLSKRRVDEPYKTERVQTLAFGTELTNGYSELNDPIDQRERFEAQAALRAAGDDEAQMMDEDFVEALEYGMPPAAGFGMSERVFAYFVDLPMREAVLFPTMRSIKIDSDAKDPSDRPDPIKMEERIDREERAQASVILGTEGTPESASSSFSSNVKADSGQARMTESDDNTLSGQDFSRKFVIVVDKDLPSWQIMNALGHATAFLGNKMDATFDTGKYFITKDGTKHPRNSQYPIIILSGKPTELKKLMSDVANAHLTHIGFTKEMIETTNDQEIVDWYKNKTEDDVEYLAIGIFGNKSEIDTLTKKFSVFK